MKKYSAIFLQVMVVLIGVGALAFMLWEPHIEGRNLNSTFFEIYFKDPFLAYAYIASVPFFVGIYKMFKVLGYVAQDRVSLPVALKALNTIKYCAIAVIGFVVGGEIFIMLSETDDRAGGVFMGILVVFGAVAMFAVAGMFERFLRNRYTLSNV